MLVLDVLAETADEMVDSVLDATMVADTAVTPFLVLAPFVGKRFQNVVSESDK
ncbi:MAG: hypothetical protein ABFC77_06980 [Thermoguttaceae bacterium]